MNICSVNKKAIDTFPQFASKQPPNGRCFEILFGRSEECKECPVKAAISSKKSTSNVIQSSPGVFWRIKADPVIENDQIKFIIKRIEIIKNLTDVEKKLSALNKEFKRSNKDLEQFAYAVSHDLREPLRMIASYLQLLDMENSDKFDEESKEFMAIAFDGAKRMNDLIDGLLQYSRVGTRGKIPAECNCNEIIKDAKNNLMLQIDEAQAVISEKNLPEKIMADRSQLIQLFSNLIGNSIKYAKPEITPKIVISCEDDNDKWQFCIADNGIGIEKQYYERIFQIFQRLHGRTTIKGYGLGLSICKRIVERHGGEIWVESDNDEGTKFFFTLPKEAVIKEDQNNQEK
ncbi:MAG: ATP-binding protein [Sedimentisphaeraceae bacterium JB056]